MLPLLYVSIIIALTCNIKLVQTDLREPDSLAASRELIDLTWLSTSATVCWVVIAALPLVVSSVKVPVLISRVSEMPIRLVSNLRSFRVVLCFLPGIRFGWVDHHDQRYMLLAFGTGASVAPLIIVFCTVVLMHFKNNRVLFVKGNNLTDTSK